jgi:hypothetical protein
LRIHARFPSIKHGKPACYVSDGSTRFLNQCRMNGDSTRITILCAMFRQAEMPNGSRRVPTVKTGSFSACHTATWVGFYLPFSTLSSLNTVILSGAFHSRSDWKA